MKPKFVERWGAVAILALFLSGCGGNRALVQTGSPDLAPTAVPTQAPSAGSGQALPPAPAASNVNQPVLDDDYQKALADANGATVTWRNLDDYFTIGQYQYNHSNFPDALKTFQKILTDVSSSSNSSPKLARAQYMVGQVYSQQKNNLPAMSAFQNVLQNYPNSPYAVSSRQTMEYMLQYSLSLDELKRFESNYPASPLKCSTLFQLGSREAQSGDSTDAVQALNSYLQQCPQHPSAATAQALLQSLRSQQKGKTWRLGVLAPTSGRFKGFGQSFVNGVTLAFEQAAQSGVPHKMTLALVQDTGGDSLKAVKLFQDMVQEDSVDAVLGPVVKSEIDTVAPLANQQKIPLLASTYPVDGLSGIGPYIFSNSMTNEMQGRAMAHYAVEHLGFKRFGILSPDDGYGQTLSQAFSQTVEALGATVTAQDVYEPNSTDFQKQVADLGGQNPEAAKENDRENQRRLDELHYDLGKEIQKFIFKAQQNDTTSNTVAFVSPQEALANTLSPSIQKDVDGVLLADIQAAKGFTVRSDDLIQQAMTRLPVEFRGTTLPVSTDQWNEMSEDLQASVIITGRIFGTNPPMDATEPTWNYSIELEAFQTNPKTGEVTKLAADKLAFSVYKPIGMVPNSLKYDALYLPAHSVEIPLIASQLHYYNLNPVLLGGHLWQNDSVLQEDPKDVEGSYFVTGFFPDSQEGTAKDFVTAYLQRFAAKPDLVAAEAYDAAKLLIKAGDSAVSVDDLRNQILAIKDFDGVGGKTSFNGKGEADKEVPIIQIKDGKYQQVQ
jgi:ABC-type branched-subunit amino acid transport system substrate-binding protein